MDRETIKGLKIGSQLYSPICGKCKLVGYYPGHEYPILVESCDRFFSFTDEGKYVNHPNAECVLFVE